MKVIMQGDVLVVEETAKDEDKTHVLGEWEKFNALFDECFKEYIEDPEKPLPRDNEGILCLDIFYDSKGRDEFSNTSIDVDPDKGIDEIRREAQEIWRELAIHDFKVGIESVSGIQLGWEDMD